jgi:hypothetical protein
VFGIGLFIVSAVHVISRGFLSCAAGLVLCSAQLIKTRKEIADKYIAAFFMTPHYLIIGNQGLNFYTTIQTLLMDYMKV